ncbi:hypothetical protein Y032_0056g2676 [Ancylostoma ceylanicum]|uniref:Uncharacterized protein n=1 Tax=Ancylostoma ceylanicum TaxID=53326 RepID=A0A016U4T3_9BILA|nr:hypothetical protein Y032_0056g2676 [Ancylostoma ceylanicum]
MHSIRLVQKFCRFFFVCVIVSSTLPNYNLDKRHSISRREMKRKSKENASKSVCLRFSKKEAIKPELDSRFGSGLYVESKEGVSNQFAYCLIV